MKVAQKFLDVDLELKKMEQAILWKLGDNKAKEDNKFALLEKEVRSFLTSHRHSNEIGLGVEDPVATVRSVRPADFLVPSERLSTRTNRGFSKHDLANSFFPPAPRYTPIKAYLREELHSKKI